MHGTTTVSYTHLDVYKRQVYRLRKLGRQYYNLKISTNKTNVIAHYGKYPVRSKIIIDDKVLEQTSTFNYLGCDISFDVHKDI